MKFLKSVVGINLENLVILNELGAITQEEVDRLYKIYTCITDMLVIEQDSVLSKCVFINQGLATITDSDGIQHFIFNLGNEREVALLQKITKLWYQTGEIAWKRSVDMNYIMYGKKVFAHTKSNYNGVYISYQTIFSMILRHIVFDESATDNDIMSVVHYVLKPLLV